MTPIQPEVADNLWNLPFRDLEITGIPPKADGIKLPERLAGECNSFRILTGWRIVDDTGRRVHVMERCHQAGVRGSVKLAVWVRVAARLAGQIRIWSARLSHRCRKLLKAGGCSGLIHAGRHSRLLPMHLLRSLLTLCLAATALPSLSPAPAQAAAPCASSPPIAARRS